jgi:arsenate reductase
MAEAPYRVLFLCTGNSCRSVMAEALFNARGNEAGDEIGEGRAIAYSAGSRPAGFVHPQALACLERNGIPVDHPRSKSWDEFAGMDAGMDAGMNMSLVVTVCDNAAGETCPLFTGSPPKVHWGLPDPALASGSDDEVTAVFQAVFECLDQHLLALIGMQEEMEQKAEGVIDLGTVARRLGPPQVTSA